MTSNMLKVIVLLSQAITAVAMGVFMQGHAFAQTAASTPAKTPEAKSGDLEEVVVTGIRASLEKSLDIKKNASVVLDSINALELGRFPDADVADSLSHLPGVTITRTTGGEGARITVRGLGPAYNLITLNDRILATDDDGRELAFDVLPSEIISGADVLKSAQASAMEGSIGGTVNLRTASPFDNLGFHGGVHAEETYNQMSHLRGTRFSAFASNTDADRALGFLIGLVHSEDNVRTDSLNAFSQFQPQTVSPDPGLGAYTLDQGAAPCCITFGSIFDKKKRDAVSGSIEWRPTSDFKLVADGLFTRLRDPQIGYNQSYYFASDPTGSLWSNLTLKNGQLVGLTSSTFQPEIVNNTTNRVVDTSLFGLKASWNVNDKLHFVGDVYRSKASRPEGGADTFVTAGLVSNQPVAQDTLIFTEIPNSLPSINVLVPPTQLGLTACPQGTASATTPGQCSYTALMNSGFLNNNKYWSTHYVGLNGYSVEDQVTGFTLDGDYKVESGWMTKILFGIGGSRREKNRVDSSNDWTNGSSQYNTLYNTFGCNVQCTPYSFGSQGFNVISMVNPPNFMQGAGGSYTTTLPQINAAQLFAFLKSLDGKLNPNNCTQPVAVPPNTTPPLSSSVDCAGQPFNYANSLPQPNAFNSYSVTEKTTSAYGELQFAGTNWSGNVGLRLVHTVTTAATHVAIPTALWAISDVGSTVGYTVIYSTNKPVSTTTSYTIPLPSLNINYWLKPEEVQLRIGLAQTMSRPTLNYLAPTSQNGAINGTATLNYNGTSGLRPIKSSQADISIEWYYQPHDSLTAALFTKRLRDDIYTRFDDQVNLGTLKYVGGPPGTPGVVGTPFLWTVSAPINAITSNYYGIELAWQHLLDNGFGAHVQYTYTKSSSGAVNGVPPTTLSVGLLYEKGPISTDLNWDYAASYSVASSTEIAVWPAIQSPYKWLTASAHYKFTKEFQVYLEGKNLTNSVARTYLNGNPYEPWANGQQVGQSVSGVGTGYTAYGRFFTLGASYQF